MKTLIFTLFLLSSIQVEAQIKFQWLGVTSFVLSDGKTDLIFDPAMTRAGLMDYILFRKVKTDEKEVDYWLNQCQVKKIDAVFVNHTHFDHAADASFVAKKFNAPLFGSSSAMNMGKGQGVKQESLHQIKAGDELTVGDFKIKIFSTPHPPHAFGIQLMDGNIEQPLPIEASVWDYQVGETFSFLITHPKGTILYQAIGKIYDQDPLKGVLADAMIITIANRPSTEQLIEKRIKPSGAKTIIPVHHDNFFYPMRRDGQIDYFWGVKFEEFKEKNKDLKVIDPRYCQTTVLFSE